MLAEQFPTETWGADDLTALSDAMLTRLEVALAIVPELGEHADALRVPSRTSRPSARPGSPPPPSACTATSTSGRRCAPSRAGRSWTSRASRPSRWPSGSVPTWCGATSPACSGRSTTRRTPWRPTSRPTARRPTRSRSAPRSGPTATPTAFLRGYVENSGRTSDGRLSPEQDLILRAYIADKAVYEAVYEARNRPTWLPHPSRGHRQDHPDPGGERRMSTVLPLDRAILDQVVDGRHGNPHDVLGAHPHDGAVTIRTFRPLAESVVVVHGSSRTPLTHEYEGIWAGVVDVPEVPGLPARGHLRRRRAADHRRRLPLPAHARRGRPAPDQRGSPRAAVGRARLARAHLRRPDGAGHRHLVRGVGAARQGRPPQGRLQQLGRPRAPDAPARHLRRVGAVRARRGLRLALQVRGARRRRRVAREGRPDGVPHRGRRRPRPRWCSTRPTPGATTRG